MTEQILKKRKRLKLDDLTEVARLATRKVLEGYILPEDLSQLVLGTMFSDDKSFAIFELYLAAERPEDAQVLTRTTVDRYTGEVVNVEIFLEPKLNEWLAMSQKI